MRALSSLALLALAAPGVATARDAGAPVAHAADIIYGRRSDLALTLDVFTPARQNGAGVVHLANGGWHRAHDQTACFAEPLRRGYTLFPVVVGGEPRFTLPEQALDVARAVRFIRHHARDYGIDPGRLGIEGASSGGHLALLAAHSGDDGNPAAADPVDRTPSRLQAAACFFPLTDLLNYGGPGKVQRGDLGPLSYHRASFDFQTFDPKLRCYVKVTDDGKVREILRAVSPIAHVSKDSPPTLLIHGDKDEVVPLQQSEVMLARLKDAGVPARLVVKPGGGHPWPEFWQKDGPALADWFDRHLGKR